jgi:hypothetical protein
VQNRSIPKAGPPRSTFGSDSSCLASLCALPSTDGLGLRQSGPPGEAPILGTGPLATLHPTSGGEGWHHQTNRLAYLSTFVFNVAEGKWSRHKGHAGTASACVHTRDTRHVHAGRNPGKASGSSRGSQTIFSECKGSLGNRRQNRRYEFLRKVVPFCAYEFLSKPLEVVGSKVASPTGCEPVLPP